MAEEAVGIPSHPRRPDPIERAAEAGCDTDRPLDSGYEGGVNASPPLGEDNSRFIRNATGAVGNAAVGRQRTRLEEKRVERRISDEKEEKSADRSVDMKGKTSINYTEESLDKDVEKADDSISPSETHTQDAAEPETSSDPNTVDWDGPDDPANPMNWTGLKRGWTVAIVSLMTIVTPLASSMFAPSVPQLMEEFHNPNTLLASFVVSVYLLGFTVGPLIVAPLSEIYGRVPCYHGGNVFFIIFTVACAVSTDVGMFCAFRFFQGCAGVTPLTLGGGTIADMTPQAKRGAAMAVWAMGPLMGPIIGPVAGGFLSQAEGWRWVFWVIAMFGGVVSIAGLIVLRESYAPVLLDKKAKRLRKETGNPNLTSKLDQNLPRKEFFKRAFYRPSKMLIRSPIVLLLSLNMAIVYGYLYLVFTTITYVFEGQYGFSSGTSGLTFLGIGVGMFVGLLAIGLVSDRMVKAKAQKEGSMKPEYRLPPLLPGTIVIPIGLFWYGWSAEANTAWILPIIGTSFIGIGLILCFMSINTYFIDAFTLYAASAMAANTILRSLVGAVLPLAGQSMYAKLGLGWGNSLLGFIALLMCPVAWLFIKYGERIRTSKRFAVEF